MGAVAEKTEYSKRWNQLIRSSVDFIDPDFCDFSWSGFLWLFMIWISVTFIDQDICDLYSSRFLWILFIQISVTFIDPDFCDFSWSEFLWLLLIRISVTFIHPDFYEFYLSRLLWLLLRLSTKGKIVFSYSIALRPTWLKPKCTRKLFPSGHISRILCGYGEYTNLNIMHNMFGFKLVQSEFLHWTYFPYIYECLHACVYACVWTCVYLGKQCFKKYRNFMK